MNEIKPLIKTDCKFDLSDTKTTTERFPEGAFCSQQVRTEKGVLNKLSQPSNQECKSQIPARPLITYGSIKKADQKLVNSQAEKQAKDDIRHSYEFSVNGDKLSSESVKIGEYFASGCSGAVSTGQLLTPEKILDVAIKKRSIYIPALEKMAEKELGILEVLKNKEHPNIVKYYGAFKEKNELNMVFELGKGTLESYIKESPEKITPELILDLAFQFLEAADFLVANKVIYYDFKPANILFDDDSQTAKLIDFDKCELADSAEDKRLYSVLTSMGLELAKLQLRMDYKEESNEYKEIASKFDFISIFSPPSADGIGEFNSKKELWSKNLPLPVRELIFSFLVADTSFSKKLIEGRSAIKDTRVSESSGT
ncbi:protein kinase family protein [Thalassotalea sp. G20_0]|uniref:protein kinase family protein n=1 Tax=Thalassotalea sp. G20_0 TaxID=2821093 RepID=UPI001ADA48CD|nr:protein kinase family protein [Thalassotalea sp. G20_0]MBO9492523.1 protein kinase family protein [Thalassotalea sp. G20_0]